MTPVLLLVDLQNDFLARPGLEPPRDLLVERAAELLEGLRRRGAAVGHARTVVRTDGTNRMPHWTRAGYRGCTEGTPGCEAPSALRERADEPVFRKSYYSAFEDPGLAPWLARTGRRELAVAGLYLHGCVRATVLDAYARGFEVCVAADAVASPEPDHARLTREWLDGRAATFATVAQILERL